MSQTQKLPGKTSRQNANTSPKTTWQQGSKSTTIRSSSSSSLTILLLLLLLLASPPVNAYINDLNKDNYDEMTKGKAVFIKFYAPWCSYCKRLEKDWDKLAQKWQNHDIGLVAEVDCTSSGGKPLCNYLHIESFPTLKFGDPYDLEDYDGNRSFQELDAFAVANLVPVCSVDHLDLCEPELKQRLQEYSNMDESKLKALMVQEEAKMEKAEKEFQQLVDSLSEKYEAAERERRKVIDEVMNGVLPSMRAVLAARKRSENVETSQNDGKEEL